MAGGPTELEPGSLEFDHLHTKPRTTRRGRRATLRSIGALLTGLAVVFAGGAMFSRADGAPVVDPAANSVRALFGAPSFGPTTGLQLNANFIDIAATPSGKGYWAVAGDGGVFSFGDARFQGSTGGMPLVAPVVGVAPTKSGKGYWLVAADGGVFSFGDAKFRGALGSAGSTPVSPILAMAATRSGNGYWLVGADGGVFAFGDAKFQGAATSVPHSAPIVSIAPTRSGLGYYLLAGDGGVFAFGDAKFRGSAVGSRFHASGIAVPVNGRGYMVARTDGSVVGFGGARSTSAPPDFLVNQHPVVDITARRGGGAWLALSFNPPAPTLPAPSSPSQHPFLVCTRAHESDSAGGYRAVSSDGLYHGAYQFLQSTWNSVARAAGRPDLVGVSPENASVADQDQLALFHYHQAGNGPWGGRC